MKAFPTKQQRSERTRDKLLQAGRLLLRSGGFDDMSIAQISARAGCSVGSFYLRFRNKEAYFEFLMDGIGEEVREDAREQLNAESVAGLTLTQTVRRCVDHYVEVHRQHEGLIRAALQYGINGSDDWQPMRDNGLWLHAHYIALIMGKLRRHDPVQAEQQLMIGLQIISGHLVNSIAHPQTTLPLHHPDTGHWLAEMVMHSLKVPLAASSTADHSTASSPRASRSPRPTRTPSSTECKPPSSTAPVSP